MSMQINVSQHTYPTGHQFSLLFFPLSPQALLNWKAQAKQCLKDERTQHHWSPAPSALGLFSKVPGLPTSRFSLASHIGNHQGCIVVSFG